MHGGMAPFILHLCLLLFVAEILPNAAASSHHSRRYAAYDYDLTTPIYTPDGRLLQVEYATNACIRDGSNPIVGVGISIPGDEGPVVIMATVSSPPSPSSVQTNHSQNGGSDRQAEEEIGSSINEENQKAQFRIIQVPLAASYRSSIQPSATSTVLIGLSGLLSDATSLIQIAYSHLEEEQHLFGWHRLGLSPVGINALGDNGSGSAARCPPPSLRKQSQSILAQPSETVLRLSRAIADKCQKHAFGGGLRPFGASLLLAGGDDARVVMCESHPNGGWRSHVSTPMRDGSRADTNGNAHDSIYSPHVMVSGGPVQSQFKLKSLIQSHLQELHQKSNENGVSPDDAPVKKDGANGISSSVPAEGKDKESILLRQVLQSIISFLVEEWRARGDPRWSSPGSPRATSSDDDSKNLQSKYEQKYTQRQHPAPPLMEVVIMSQRRGTIRLTQSDVARLLSSI